MILITLSLKVFPLFMFLSWTLDAVTDFSTTNSAMTFTSGTSPSSECITVNIVNDNNFEGSHNFVVSITSITPPIAPTGSTTTVFIQDNNGKLLIL